MALEPARCTALGKTLFLIQSDRDFLSTFAARSLQKGVRSGAPSSSESVLERLHILDKSPSPSKPKEGFGNVVELVPQTSMLPQTPPVAIGAIHRT